MKETGTPKLSRYNEDKNRSYKEISDTIRSYWKTNDIFTKSITNRKGNPTFTFFEGPPSANGMPGIHHVMARTIKDIFCRYKTLKGYQVGRKGGWDTHGLPVELQVEKELGITKEDIGKTISVEEYNQKCREAVMRFTSVWDDITEKMGFWVDLENPYITYDAKYIESLWNLLKKLYDKDLLYKGYTIQPYSPAAGTGLSSHELNMPGAYKNVKDTTIVAQFKIKGSFNDYLLAWTTTPWTLPSNSALVVNPEMEYVKVQTHNQYTNRPINVIMAKAAVGRMLTPEKYLPNNEFSEEKHPNKIPYTIIEQFKGSYLLGLQYEQLLPYVQPLTDVDKAFHVIEGDFVTAEDGTGIVHAAPTFGADDYRVAKKHGVPAIMVLDEFGREMPLVDQTGRFVKEMGEFAGCFVKAEYEDLETQQDPEYKSVDVRIAIQLKTDNKAFKVEKYEHNYPHCWRTDKPILYYPMSSWFIRTTAYKDKMVQLNKTINWKPAHTGEGRFGNWLENLVDWNLSRSRYWGTPLPIWIDEETQESICIGSLEELEKEINNAQKSTRLSAEEKDQNAIFLAKYKAGDVDLHRPYVDRVTLLSPKGTVLKRELDLVDVWFDSGAMPYAQWHYPFENQEIFETNFPADFIAEGVDQTRGWFFTLHALSSMLFDSVAFKNVISNGLVLDKNGNKMSKRLGNAIDPFQTLDQYGSDPVRWYMIENSSPWDNLKFNLDGIQETQRKFFSTLQNTYSFFAMYANLDGYVYDEKNPIAYSALTESDKWILSCLMSLVQKVEEAYEEYEPTKVARFIQDFVSDDLSNWYVRLNRKRFWVGETSTDKLAAYQTLFQCLETVARLAAPIAPFYMDYLYRNLHQASEEQLLSVHLADFPVSNSSYILPDLEAQMRLAQGVCTLVHSIRKKEKIRVRQPLAKVMVPVVNAHERANIELVKDLILNEVNIKELQCVTDEDGIMVKLAKPNFKILGGKYGKRMKALGQRVSQLNQQEIAEIQTKGSISISFDEEGAVDLLLEEVEIVSKDIPGWLVSSDKGLTVALDISLTPELIREGIARDLVNRIQNRRKDMGLEVQDRILLQIEKGNEAISTAVKEFEAYICRETQCNALTLVESLPEAILYELEEDSVRMEVQKA